MEELLLSPDWAEKSFLLFYENQNSVVLGKNQNFLAEVNQKAYYQTGEVDIERRISGGGTVFHGPGNLNFAFIRPHKDSLVNNFKAFNEPIVAALNHLGIPAAMNQRNDILCNGFKISGNAQFTNRKRMISHGTLLVSAKLDLLRKFLKPNPFELETRSIPSVRSKVANINAFSKEPLSASIISNAITSQIGKSEPVIPMEISNDFESSIHTRIKDRFSTWEWKFARASKANVSAEIANETIKLEVRDGLIKSPIHKDLDGFKLGSERKQPERIPGLLQKIFFDI